MLRSLIQNRMITYMAIGALAIFIAGCSVLEKSPVVANNAGSPQDSLMPPVVTGADTWPSSVSDFKWPVVRNQIVRIYAGYGPGGSPYHTGREYYALDLINGDSPGDTRWMWVLNPARGVVREAGWSNSRGWFVIIDHHNGWESRIYHLQTDPRSFIAEENDLLQGTFLGYTGSSGWTTGPHIHFVVLHNGWSVPLNGIDGDYDLRVGWNYTSSNVYLRPPFGNP